MVVIWQITSCKLFVFNKFRSFTWSGIHITLLDGIHERHLEYSHRCWWWRFWPFCSEQQGDGKSRDWSTQEELRSLQPQRLTTGISFRELFDNRRHALQIGSTWRPLFWLKDGVLTCWIWKGMQKVILAKSKNLPFVSLSRGSPGSLRATRSSPWTGWQPWCLLTRTRRLRWRWWPWQGSISCRKDKPISGKL